MWYREPKTSVARRGMVGAFLFILLLHALPLASANAAVMARARSADRAADSSTLPAGSTVQLGPTYADTGALPTVSVGQGATFRVSVPGPCGSPCWLDQGYAIDLFVVEAAHAGSADACSQSLAAIKVSTSRNGGAGNLFIDGGFTWPAAASSTAYGSPWYALCIHVEVPSSSEFYPKPDYLTGAVTDEVGANTTVLYKVISNHAPTVSVSPQQVAQGQTVTITGHYWIPVYADDPNTLVGANIDQYPYAYATVNLAHQQAQVDGNGTWTVTFPISAGYAPGTYYACVGSVDVTTYCQGWRTGVPFTVVAASTAPTATPGATSATPSATSAPSGTSTASATPSAPADPTATAAPNTGLLSTPSGSGDHGAPPWTALVLVFALAALVGGGIAIFFRRMHAIRP